MRPVSEIAVFLPLTLLRQAERSVNTSRLIAGMPLCVPNFRFATTRERPAAQFLITRLCGCLEQLPKRRCEGRLETSSFGRKSAGTPPSKTATRTSLFWGSSKGVSILKAVGAERSIPPVQATGRSWRKEGTSSVYNVGWAQVRSPLTMMPPCSYHHDEESHTRDRTSRGFRNGCTWPKF